MVRSAHRAGVGRGHERLPGPSRAGTVAAEIGGDRGAAVVRVPPSWLGDELEIRRVGEAWTGSHVAVLERRLPRGTESSAFFPALGAGIYEVRRRGHPPDIRTLRFPVAAG